MAQDEEIGMQIGEQLPATSLTKTINFNGGALNTADYKDKLLILDFWSTGCPSCIAALPLMAQLEEKYAGRIKILPVTSQQKDIVLDFWKKNKYTKNLFIPSVVEDTILHSYFKHRFVSHEVWIYRGKVIAITPLEYVDDYNIKRILNGENVNFPLKNDFYSYDHNKPLFSYDSNQVDHKDAKIQYAAISDFRKRVNSPLHFSGGSGLVRDSVKKNIRLYFLNQPILTSYYLYWFMANDGKRLILPQQSFQNNQVIWEVRNQSQYMFFKKNQGDYSQDWMLKNSICFESVHPDTGQKNNVIYQNAIADLDRLLGLKVRWEIRREKVLVIVKKKHTVHSINKIKSKLYSIQEIFYNLNLHSSSIYIFNESGDDSSKLQLNFKSWTDITGIRQSLQVGGFDLIEKERFVHKLIFSEVNGGMIVDREKQLSAVQRKIDSDLLQKPSPQQNDSFLEKNGKINGVYTTPSGLQYRIIKRGNGTIPKSSSRVLVDYEGTLINGKIFDSTYENGTPNILTVGNTIKGFNEALQLMREGDVWTLFIPPYMAYGSHTASGKIPPNSTLVFKIELLKVIVK